mgnify:CR=1 FL=1
MERKASSSPRRSFRRSSGARLAAATAVARARNPSASSRHCSSPLAAAGQAPLVRQVAYVVPRAFKTATLGRILDVVERAP